MRNDDWSVTDFPVTLGDGRYEVLNELGRGAQGRTLLGREIVGGREVAIKELDFGQIDRIKALELFEREARVLATLQMPGVPRYIDYFSQDDATGRLAGCYLVQEYVEGDTLQQLIDQGRLFSEDEVLEFLTQILAILERLHAREPQVIHRDIKPSNIILRAHDKRYFLVDFGAVRETVVRDSGSSTVIGTSGYAPLEQLMGRALAASDLYALGASAVCLLSHLSPVELYGDGQRLEFRERVQIGEDFAGFLEHLCAPQVEDRFKSAELARYALAPIISRRRSRDRAEEDALKQREHLAQVQQEFERWPTATQMQRYRSEGTPYRFADMRAIVDAKTRAGTAEIFAGERGCPAYAVAARSQAAGRLEEPRRPRARVSKRRGVLVMRMPRSALHMIGHALGALVLVPLGLGCLFSPIIVGLLKQDVYIGLIMCIFALTIGLWIGYLGWLQFQTLLSHWIKPRLRVDASHLRYTSFSHGWPVRIEVARSEVESVGVVLARYPKRAHDPVLSWRGPHDFRTGLTVYLMEIRLADGRRVTMHWRVDTAEKFYLMGELYQFLKS